MKTCLCRFPQPGPDYWSFRCLGCSGAVPQSLWELFRRAIGLRPR